MQEDKISARDLTSMLILYILGSALVTSGNVEAKQDTWLALIIGMVMAVPVIFIYGMIATRYPENDIFEVFYLVFGKVGGFALTAIITLYAIQLSAIIIRNFTEFIQSASLPETPQYVVAIFMGAVCIAAIKSRLSVFGRVSTLLLPFIIFGIIITTVFSIENFNLSYLKPVASGDADAILRGAFSFLAFPLGEVVVFTAMFSKLRPGTNPRKLYFMSMLIGGGLLVLSVLRNLLVLGPTLINELYFPSFSATGMININDFISRIEVVIAGNFLICGLVKVYVSIYAAGMGLKKIFNLDDYKDFSAPLILLIIALSGFLYKSTMQMFIFIKYYKYYAVFFQIIIPLITLIAIEIKLRMAKKSEKIQPS